MCGICGIVLADRSRHVEPETLTRMADAITYRGPDDSGAFVTSGVGLAMRRLSIIDLAGGHQPMHNEGRTMHVVFNGELYNYRSLRSQLLARGHRLETESDTEVIVHAYEEWGVGCLDAFRGMFAFALWDDERDSLLLAVDRFGIKPLYYGLAGVDLVFGSELVCLLASGRLEKDLDDAALAEYFTLGYVPPPATIFSGARKLEPGTCLSWTPHSGAKLSRYWDVPSPSADGGRDRRDLREELRAQLLDAVRAHLVSDVPVGAFLSGGIDSSSVVALMSQASAEPVRTFSIGFADREHDERPLARLVAERFGTEHHEHVLQPESVDVLPKIVSHFHEPFADSSALPTYYVSKFARESVKVALSGDGGDELFLGYTAFAGVELARRAQTLPAPVRALMRRVPGHVPRILGSRWNDRVGRWGKVLADTALPPDAAYRSKITMAGASVVRPLMTRDLQRRLDAQDPFRTVDAALGVVAKAAALERVAYAGIKVSLPGDMLVKVDRMSMAHSLEVRVPLLDHVLAEFVARLPITVRFSRWHLKALLKETMADVLPEPILRQPKHGFTVPLADWFRGNLAGFARDVLLDRDTRERGFLDTHALEALLGQHARGNRNVGPAIWTTLMFELWCRQVLG